VLGPHGDVLQLTAALVEWLRRDDGDNGQQEVSDEIFDAAPRALARSISLQQTVALVVGNWG
jgi:hypothetical protein